MGKIINRQMYIESIKEVDDNPWILDRIKEDWDAKHWVITIKSQHSTEQFYFSSALFGPPDLGLLLEELEESVKKKENFDAFYYAANEVDEIYEVLCTIVNRYKKLIGQENGL